MHLERLRDSFIETALNTVDYGDANIPLCVGHEGDPSDIADMGLDAAVSGELAELGDLLFETSSNVFAADKMTNVELRIFSSNV